MLSCRSSLANSVCHSAVVVGNFSLEIYDHHVRRRHQTCYRCVQTDFSRRFPHGSSMLPIVEPTRQSMHPDRRYEIFV